jgi:hypothetical protein
VHAAEETRRNRRQVRSPHASAQRPRSSHFSVRQAIAVPLAGMPAWRPASTRTPSPPPERPRPRPAGRVLGHARAAVPPPEGARGRRPARVRRPAWSGRGGVRPRPGQHGGAERIRRDVDGGLASGHVLGTPTLFIDGIVHRGGYDPPTPAGRAGGMSRPAHSAPAEGDQKPRRSLTMIAVTRPGVITLLMMRMLFTPLGTP